MSTLGQDEQRLVETLADVAEQVHRLVRKFGSDPFERRLLEWAEAVDKPSAEFEDARAKHIFRAANFDSRLCDESTGPPKPDWEWDREPVVVANLKHERSAWFPPELASSNRPELQYPLPLPEDRGLTLPEKYTALVVIYILHWKGEEIGPWQDPTRPNHNYIPSRLIPVDHPDSTDGWILFECLLSWAKRTPEDDARGLWYILLDVEADLRAIAQDGAGIQSQDESETGPPAKPPKPPEEQGAVEAAEGLQGGNVGADLQVRKSPCKPKKKPINLACWGLGYRAEIGEWWLFQYFGNMGKGRGERNLLIQMRQRGKIDIPTGLQECLAKALVEHEGRLSRREAVELFRATVSNDAWPDWPDDKVIKSKCVPTRYKLINRIRTALERTTGQTVQGDLLPWVGRHEAWISAIHFGYAISGEESRLRLVTRSQLARDTELDIRLADDKSHRESSLQDDPACRESQKKFPPQL